jgi:peptidyl-prolyl cis-trans isomerase NIMA-interacting 1
VCNTPLNHSSISRQHAAIVHSDDGFKVIDLHSTHGTRVNDKKIATGTPVLLRDMDKIRFGASSREFVLYISGSKATVVHHKRHRDSTHEHGREHRKRTRLDNDSKSASKSASRDKYPGKVHCLHILVKHAGSRRPSSWKQSVITRSIDQAMLLVASFKEKIVAEANSSDNNKSLENVFRAYATRESDCSSAKRSGDLGEFSYGTMQAPFAEVAYV